MVSSTRLTSLSLRMRKNITYHGQTLIDHIICLQNVKNFLSGSKPIVFNDINPLKQCIQKVYNEKKTLEEIYDFIHGFFHPYLQKLRLKRKV